MRRAFLLSALSAGILAGGATAQEKPDFSGRWTVEQPTAPGRGADGRGAAAQGADAQRGGGGGGRGRSGDMGSGWGSTITIAQDANRLTVEYMFFGRGDMQPPLKFVYALDGSETRNSVMMGRGIQAEKSKAAWDGDKLVITTSHTFASPADGQPVTAEVRRTLTLESPTSLKVEALRSGVLGGPSNTVTTVYVRSQGTD